MKNKTLSSEKKTKQQHRNLGKLTSIPFILMVKLYQNLISPILPKACRYEPTCSEYMIEAIKIHGIIKGIYLGTKRLLRCHPWGGSGYDPVPPVNTESKACHHRKNKIEE